MAKRGHRDLLTKAAKKIAEKLKTTRTEGTAHQVHVVYLDGKIEASFGIRRSSKQLPHPHVHRELFVSLGQARDLANCPMSLEDWEKHMRKRLADVTLEGEVAN